MDKISEDLTWLLGDFKDGIKDFSQTVTAIKEIFARAIGATLYLGGKVGESVCCQKATDEFKATKEEHPHMNHTSIDEMRSHEDMSLMNLNECQHCNGTGRSSYGLNGKCTFCQGEGKNEIYRSTKNRTKVRKT